MKKSLIIFSLFVFWSNTSMAQTKEVSLDLSTSVLSEPLPFDVPFIFTVKVPVNTHHVVLSLTERNSGIQITKSYNDCFFSVATPTASKCPKEEGIYIWENAGYAKEPVATFSIGRLQPEKEFEINISVVKALTEKSDDIKEKTYGLVRSYFKAFNKLSLGPNDVMYIRSNLINFLSEGISSNSKVLVGGDLFSGEIDNQKVAVFQGELQPVMDARQGLDNIYYTINQFLATIKTNFTHYIADSEVNIILDSSGLIECSPGKDCSELDKLKQIVLQIQNEDYHFDLIDQTTPIEITDAKIVSIKKSYDELINILANLTDRTKAGFIGNIIQPGSPVSNINDIDSLHSRIINDMVHPQLNATIDQLLLYYHGIRSIPINKGFIGGGRYWLVNNLTEFDNAIKRFADKVEFQSVTVAFIAATSTPAFADTDYENYIGVDIGLLAPMFSGISVPIDYYGFNFYLRPVNKDAPYRKWDEGGFRQRFSITLGLTRNNIENESTEKTRKGLVADRALVTGIGMRFQKSLRFNTGFMWFQKRDTENFPLNNDYSTGVIFYTGLSMDINLFKALKKAIN